MSNVGRHKEHVSESHASCRCAEAVNAGSVLSCIGCVAGKSNSCASFKTSATCLCRSCHRHRQFIKASNTRLSEPPRQGLSSSVGAGAGAPSKANVSQSVGAAAWGRSARSSRPGAARQRGRWLSSRTSLAHRRDAQPFHRGDSFRATPSSCPSCQTLGVTRNMSVNLMHRVVELKLSRPVARCCLHWLSRKQKQFMRFVPDQRDPSLSRLPRSVADRKSVV